jgi:hypothetical protein
MARLKPDLRVVCVSGYSGSQAFRYRGVPIADFAFVSKPFTPRPCCRKSDLKWSECRLPVAAGECPTDNERTFAKI